MKKKIRLIICLVIIVGVVYGVYRHIQPGIESCPRENPSLVVYDNDYMNADRLKALDCDFYKYYGPYIDFAFNPNNVEEDNDYGKSFVLLLPVTFKRKSLDEEFEVYFNVSYSNEAGKCIYVIKNRYEFFDKDVFSDHYELKTNLEICGCTCGLEDEEIEGLMKTVEVTVTITDSNGKEYEQDLHFNMEEISVKHVELEDDHEGPFFA